MPYINLTTGEQRDTLPGAIEIDGKVIPDAGLKEWATKGLRECEPVKPAPEGSVIVETKWVQSKTDPLRAEAVTTTKELSVLAAEKEAAEQAAKDAADAREAARLAERESITKAFADEKEAEAAGKLFDMIWRFP